MDNKEDRNKFPDSGTHGFFCNYYFLAASFSFVAFFIGAFLLFFGLNLSPGNPFFSDFARFLTEIRPSPAMLEKLDYKLEALASMSRSLGATIALGSFVFFYLTLKGVNILSWTSKKLIRFAEHFGGREGIRNLSFILGGSTIMLPAFLLLLFALGLHLFKLPITIYHFPSACILTFVFSWSMCSAFFKRFRTKAFLLIVSMLILLFSFSYVAGSAFYDTAFDSLAYHQESMIRLSEGWDPFSLKKGGLPDEFISSHVYTHAKTFEICAASFYKVSGNTESGKLFNFLLIFASFFISFSAVTAFPWIRIRQGYLVAGLLAFNPVSLYQSASYYVDGQLSSMMVCLFSLAVMTMLEKRFLYPIMLGFSILIAANIKLTGVVYSFVVSFGAAAFLFFKEKFSRFLAVSVSLLAAGLAAVFIVGFNPYVTNHIYHGHLFYPFFCKEAIPVISHGPPSINGKSQPEKAFVSVFSESENFYVGRLTEYKFKFPLYVSAHELTCFANPDTRLSGLGPLFGAMAIVSLAMIIGIFFYDRKVFLYAALFYLWVVGSALIITEPWWMRFVPQLWIAAVFPVVIGYNFKSGVMAILRKFLVFLAVANILLVCAVYFPSQAAATASLKRQLKEISSEYKKIYVYFPFASYAGVHRLKEAGINAEAVGAEYFKEKPEVFASDFFFGNYVGEKK